MSDEITMSNHISNLRSLINQLVEVGVVIDKDDAKSILLNSLPSKYSNVICSLIQMPPQTLEDVISTLLVEEKRAGDSRETTQIIHALYSKNNMGKRMYGKNETECFYYKKPRHIAMNCKIRANDLLKGKIKESTNIVVHVESPDVVSDDDIIENEELVLF